MPYFGKFFPVNPVIYSSLCASQSELRHLQCMVSVCVCVYVLIYDFGSDAQFW